ncbi:uncharacterized protein BDZ99DRAFT_136042 [Mytilinidion resinicola]|uniref:Pru domain-containing protein n=1 Tax=Mytilinidion resinicola TaxID=574789 RepID=A0A6A6Z839_9PEZI|nr:uncharacterized protein BDZ99DRAFT_136042 [Mytilinidion resinicola]KAF2816435.1 hypothetical protein BDZ99DRAFT_136042 [Mytilinidion resinicola]
MSIQPLITFKAGKCDLTPGTPPRIKPDDTPGFIYLYIGDELVHFCWRPRSASASDPELDLLMIPGDGSFLPYTGPDGGADSDNLKSPTNGRIFVLKFSSSSQRHLFWLQSKPQHPNGDPSWFSERDQKLGQVVDMLLSGEEVDVQEELRELQNRQGPGRPDDDDETMEDVEGTDQGQSHHRQGSGGAGPGATGGDVREEGEESREGGADGGRADSSGAGANDASAIVQNFLNSLKGGAGASGSQQQQGKPFTTLPDLLPSTTTIPVIDQADPAFIDRLCSHLPPMLLLLAQEIDDLEEVDPTSDTAQAAIQALSIDQKKGILKRVLRSPQLHQSLGSVTVALRDGGLPTVSEALKIKVANGGYIKHGGMPLGAGEAVEAFLEGVKSTVLEEKAKGDEGKMDTD